MSAPPAPAAETQAGAVAFNFMALNKKYAEEKEKRQRSDGVDQYIELASADPRFRKLAEDPWVDHAALNALPPNLRDGDEVKVLALGAGYGGLLSAIRLVQAGFRTDDVRLVDAAGGFGGTWYWNRYPGLMCDVESYIYMPLLEETGYVPKHRYAYGPELREHAERMAEKWGLADKGVFRTQIKSYDWDEDARRWIVALEQDRGPEGVVSMKVKAQFVILANGVLNHPKVARNLEAFEGPVFHTARWDYGVTGGSPEEPNMTGLEGKRVGIIGTGATGIQVVPQLARHAKELYVFQRTPSAVGERGQRPTDPEEFRTKVATGGTGWQRRRTENFNDMISGHEPAENLVNDGWTEIKAYKCLIGGKHEKPLGMEDIPGHIGNLLALDTPRSEMLRRRAEEIVKDKKTAEALKGWYPSWCKRPTFHDDYLPAFNLPNVHLVDTDGKGVDRATKDGLVVSGTEYPLDILVLSTGYRPPGVGMAEPSAMSNAVVRGRGGVLLAEKWAARGPSTLHGVLTSGFPNMFLTGPMQTGATSNFAYVGDTVSQHTAHILAEAVKRAGPEGEGKIVIESVPEAEEAYAMQILMRAAWFAALGVCTPSYINNEGHQAPPEDQMKLMRGAPWPTGMNDWVRFLEEWRAEGSMKGISVTA
ncbi:flavin-binding monooxygenase-like family protein (cyclohexanone monooxygenase) [Colletotrichum sojae]|uniref:Flavin-binding monooxygenase-like family protein (Cyclohexanone monooxygenase) n=1 Tax=Colletotrichum sojae TaxID=2175907 RepID=A0A8H6J520_9PEZI|nr:flavin-binding monooxygenase-like family protein (cyclohexanone monooxygenase) [Colletotrichum sojae]